MLNPTSKLRPGDCSLKMEVRRVVVRTAVLLVLLCTIWINKAVAQKSALKLRIDTVTVKFGTKDTLVPIYFGITGTKPANVRGYGSYVNFNPSQLGDSLAILPSMIVNGVIDTMAYVQYVDTAMANLMFAGTASASLPSLFAILRGEIRAIELCENCPGVVLTNPVLYRVYLSMDSVFSDTAFLQLSRFDQTSGQPFDTVLIENGWIRYQRSPLTLSMANAKVSADSLVTIPVKVTDITSANVREAIFSSTFDTSVLTFVGSVSGSISGNSLVYHDSISGNRIVVAIRNSDSTKPLVGSGTLLSLQFRAKSRTDTVCTMLRDTAFRALNTDALISIVTLSLGEICVQGQIPQAVAAMPQSSKTTLDVWPNPFETKLNIHFRTEGNSDWQLEIYDALGRSVATQRLNAGSFVWYPESQLAGGVYLLRIVGARQRTSQPETLQREILLIH